MSSATSSLDEAQRLLKELQRQRLNGNKNSKKTNGGPSLLEIRAQLEAAEEQLLQDERRSTPGNSHQLKSIPTQPPTTNQQMSHLLPSSSPVPVVSKTPSPAAVAANNSLAPPAPLDRSLSNVDPNKTVLKNALSAIENMLPTHVDLVANSVSVEAALRQRKSTWHHALKHEEGERLAYMVDMLAAAWKRERIVNERLANVTEQMAAALVKERSRADEAVAETLRLRAKLTSQMVSSTELHGVLERLHSDMTLAQQHNGRRDEVLVKCSKIADEFRKIGRKEDKGDDDTARESVADRSSVRSASGRPPPAGSATPSPASTPSPPRNARRLPPPTS